MFFGGKHGHGHRLVSEDCRAVCDIILHGTNPTKVLQMFLPQSQKELLPVYRQPSIHKQTFKIPPRGTVGPFLIYFYMRQNPSNNCKLVASVKKRVPSLIPSASDTQLSVTLCLIVSVYLNGRASK